MVVINIYIIRIAGMEVGSMVNDYRIIKNIGEGGYGDVYLVENAYQQLYALKQIKINNPNQRIPISQQGRVAAGLKHPNILTVYSFFFHNKQTEFILISQYCDGVGLDKYIGEESINNIMHVMSQIAEGVNYLHEKSIVHRDIKPENILFSKGEIKIVDLGLAKVLTNVTMLSTKGTYFYMAYEMLQNNNQYGTQVDIWGMGLVFLELLLKKRITDIIPGYQAPASRANFPDNQLFQKIQNPILRDLVRKMLIRNKKERINSKDVLVMLKEAQQVTPGKITDKSKLIDKELIAKLKKQGLQAKQKKDFKLAVNCFQQLLKIIPNDQQILNLLISTYRKMGNFKQALKISQNLLEINPKKDIGYYNMGATLNALGKFDEAIKNLEISAKLNPKNSRTYYSLGFAYKSLEKYQQAIKNYQNATQLDNRFQQAYKDISLIYYQLEKYQLAIKNFDIWLKINPNSTEAYNYYGKVLRKQGKHEQSIKYFQNAIKCNPKNDTAYNDLGSALYSLKRYQQALKKYQNSIKINQNNDMFYFNLGLTLAILGKIQQAIQIFQHCLKINPNNADVYYNLGVNYDSLEKKQLAIKNYQLAINVNPKYLNAYYNLAAINQNLGNIDKAYQYYKTCIKINPNKQNAKDRMQAIDKKKGKK